MKISVMIITYNRKREILRALESCVCNKIEEMEFVIVDNNSSDGTQEAVEKFFCENNIKYKYYYSSENLGISNGRNKAFEMCTGEYIVCLDDDAVVITKDFFAKIYSEMKKHDAVAAALKIYEPQNDRFLKGFVYEENNELLALSYIGAGHVLRRDFFESSKLYPGTLRFGSEEYYVAYRIRKYKKKMIYLENVEIHHLPSNVARVYGDERDVNIIANNYVIRKMCYPIFCIPILKLMLFLRMLKHEYYFNGYSKKINKMIKERYSVEYVDRMGISTMIKMLKDVGVAQVF